MDGQYPVHLGTPRAALGKSMKLFWVCSCPFPWQLCSQQRKFRTRCANTMVGKQRARFPAGGTVAAQLKARLHPSRCPGTGFCYFGQRSKYSKLCLCPAHGHFCRGQHQVPVSKLPDTGILPQSATHTPGSPGRVQGVGSCATTCPMCVWGLTKELSEKTGLSLTIFLLESSRCPLQSCGRCICGIMYPRS